MLTVQPREPLPHDIQVEQELLGAVLMNNRVFQIVQRHVNADDFYEPLHQEIFRIAEQLINAGKPAVVTTLASFLPKDVTVSGMPLRKYLAAMVANCTTEINADAFACIVKDLSLYRGIIMLTEQMTSLRDSADPVKIATEAIERLSEIVALRGDSDTPAVDMGMAVTRAVDAAAHAFQRDGKPRGIPYGLRALDDKTLGAMPGQLIVIGGRTSSGKSAMALSITRNFALGGHRTLFFSLEMGDVDLTTRIIADEIFRPGNRLSYWQIAAGKFHENRFVEITDAATRLQKLPIRIEQQPGLTVAQIGVRSRQYKRRHGLAAIIVDHLGLVRASGRYAGSRVYEIGEITGALKELAKELGVPIFLLAQLNRGVENRDDKRPTMSDLRDSGSIEQDADTIMLLYRPAYYLARKEPAAGSAEFIIWADEMAKVENLLEVGIEKQRSGPTGRVKLFIDVAANAIRDEFSEMDETIPLSEKERADFK